MSESGIDPPSGGSLICCFRLFSAKTKPNFMAKFRKQKGTKRADVLTGSAKRDYIKGLKGDDVIDTYEGNDKVKGGGGDDIITTGIGMDKAWGGSGDDLFVTENNGEGFVKIMDFEVGDRIQFCGCLSTRIEMRGKNAYIMKGDDIKAVVKGVDADDLELDYDSKMIFIAPDPLA